MFSPEYEKRILKHWSPVARNLFDNIESSTTPTSLDRFIPCRWVNPPQAVIRYATSSFPLLSVCSNNTNNSSSSSSNNQSSSNKWAAILAAWLRLVELTEPQSQQQSTVEHAQLPSPNTPLLYLRFPAVFPALYRETCCLSHSASVFLSVCVSRCTVLPGCIKQM